MGILKSYPFLQIQLSMVILVLEHGWGLSCNWIVSECFLLSNPALFSSLQMCLLSVLLLYPALSPLATALTWRRSWPRHEGCFHTDFLGSFFITSPPTPPSLPGILDLYYQLTSQPLSPMSTSSLRYHSLLALLHGPIVWSRICPLGENLGECEASPLSMITALYWSLPNVSKPVLCILSRY